MLRKRLLRGLNVTTNRGTRVPRPIIVSKSVVSLFLSCSSLIASQTRIVRVFSPIAWKKLESAFNARKMPIAEEVPVFSQVADFRVDAFMGAIATTPVFAGWVCVQPALTTVNVTPDVPAMATFAIALTSQNVKIFNSHRQLAEGKAKDRSV